ncbi:MAG: hypothetical protein Kow0080_10520 [Candidatus Promineifilaceae bacterium]
MTGDEQHPHLQSMQPVEPEDGGQPTQPVLSLELEQMDVTEAVEGATAVSDDPDAFHEAPVSGGVIREPGGLTFAEMLQNRFGWGAAVPALLFVLLAAAAIWLYFSLAFSWETAVIPQRQILQFSTNFQPVILHKGVYTHTPPAVDEGAAYIVGSIDPDSRPDLIRLNLQTGEVAWRAPAEDDQFPLTASGKVFIEDNHGTTGGVRALNGLTGHEIWTRSFRLLGGSHVDYFSVVDSGLSVRLQDSILGSYYLIDQETGQTIQQKRSNTQFVFLIDRDPLRVYEALPGMVRVSSREGWQAEVPGDNLYPQAAGDVILVQYTPFGSQADALMALDRVTGAVLWQRMEPVVSNTAVSGSTLFTLIELQGGVQLLALDLHSGDLLGTMLFSEDADLSRADYFVATDGKVTAVYFGDSRELFVLNWLGAQ